MHFRAFLIHVRISNFYILVLHIRAWFSTKETYKWLTSTDQIGYKIDLVFLQHFQNGLLNFGSQWYINIKIRRSFWIKHPPLENISPHHAPCSSYSLHDNNLPLLLTDCYMVAIIVLKPHCYLTSLSDAQVLPVPGVNWVKASMEFEDYYIVCNSNN